MIWENITTNYLQTVIRTMDMSDPEEISSSFSVRSPWNVALHTIIFSTAALHL